MQQKQFLIQFLCLALVPLLFLCGGILPVAEACRNCDDGSAGIVYYPVKGKYFTMERNGTFTIQAEAVEVDYVDTHQEAIFGTSWTNRPWQWEIVHTFFSMNNNAPITKIVMTGQPKRIGDYAFYQFRHVKRVVIPSSVREICDYSFLYTGLTSVVMPKSVTKIGEQAFPSNNLTIYYEGTPEQWQKIRFETPINANIVYNHQIDVAVTEQPRSAIVKQLNEAQFSVTGSGEVMEYLWQYSTNGGETWYNTTSTIQGYNTPTLTVRGEIERNGFLYRCRLTDWNGNYIYSNGAALAIYPVLMNITRQPQNLTVTIGETAEFSLEAIGDSLAYCWEYQANGSSTWQETAFTSNQLTTVAAFEHNGDKYRCKITDSEGNVYYSEEVTLTVRSPFPQIQLQPTDTTVPEGTSVVLKVEAEGYQLQYQWQYQIAGSSLWYNSSSATQGYNTDTLTVRASLARNGYKYRCKISDPSGNVLYSAPATLTVQAATLEFTDPRDVTIKQGAKAYFQVTASEDDLSYQWEYSINGTYWMKASSYTTGYNTPNLVVLGEAKRNAFWYRCKITDSLGNVFRTKAAQLTVQTPESSCFASQPETQYIMAGNQAVFTVKPQGNVASIQWQYQTAPGKAWYNSTAATLGYNTDTLTVEATEVRNHFRYRCLITDTDGYVHTSQEAELVLTLVQLTMQPQDQTVAVGEAALFFVVAEGDLLNCYWQYSPDGGKSWYAVSSFAGHDSLAMVVPAQKNRDGFLYRCVLLDSYGNRLYSDSALLTVLPD